MRGSVSLCARKERTGGRAENDIDPEIRLEGSLEEDCDGRDKEGSKV